MSALTRGLKRLSISKNKDKKPRKRGSTAGLTAADKPAVARLRRRLSVTDADGDATLLDGTSLRADRPATAFEHADETKTDTTPPSKAYTSFGLKSKVGYVPFNPNKVNQDRGMIVGPIMDCDSNGVFGVFDGHGMNGDDVSSFITHNMTHALRSMATSKGRAFEKLKTAWITKKDPSAGLTELFSLITRELKKSPVNCTFSGSTATVVYLDDHKYWCANAGDSRAVLGRRARGSASSIQREPSSNAVDSATSADTAVSINIKSEFEAVPLSFDNKPDNPEEQTRIESCNGRVEPCKTPTGEFIGPARVWLKHQDMPGLAMSRSFGDDIATAVGVHSEPEVVIVNRTNEDLFMVLGSDGLWEFISNEEAVNIAGKYIGEPEKAAKVLLQEATKRWQKEEEVIDDITVIVVNLQRPS